jgi:hypothetical protein
VHEEHPVVGQYVPAAQFVQADAAAALYLPAVQIVHTVFVVPLVLP